MGFADLVTAADDQVLDSLGKVSVTYAPSSGSPVVVEGIFDENYIVLEENEFGFEQITPAVWLHLDDLPSDPDTDTPVITINGVEYLARARPRDSLSLTVRLLLHRRDRV